MSNNIQSVKNSSSNNSAKIFSIIGFVFSFFNGLTGLILSAIGLGKYKKQTDKSLKGMAIAGVILSILKMISKIAAVIIICLTLFLILCVPAIGALIVNIGSNTVVSGTVSFSQNVSASVRAEENGANATVCFYYGYDEYSDTYQDNAYGYLGYINNTTGAYYNVLPLTIKDGETYLKVCIINDNPSYNMSISYDYYTASGIYLEFESDENWQKGEYGQFEPGETATLLLKVTCDQYFDNSDDIFSFNLYLS